MALGTFAPHMAKLRYHLTFIDEESELSTASSDCSPRVQSCPPSVCRGNWEWSSALQVPLGRGLGYFGVGEMQTNAVKHLCDKKKLQENKLLYNGIGEMKDHTKPSKSLQSSEVFLGPKFNVFGVPEPSITLSLFSHAPREVLKLRERSEHLRDLDFVEPMEAPKPGRK